MTDSRNEQAITKLFGEPISVYTRAQAIEDGVLVDAGSMASEAGFRWPVAFTAAAWADCTRGTAGRTATWHWVSSTCAGSTAATGAVREMIAVTSDPSPS